MTIVERLIVALFPTFKIRYARWKIPWEQREQQSFIFGARVFFGFFFLAYLLHYFLIDLPLKKEPIALWAKYRFGLAGISLIGLFLAFTSWSRKSRNYRIPVIISGLIFGYMQSRSMVWRQEVPYFYSIVIPVIASVAIRKSVFESIAYLFCAYLIEFSAWATRATELPYIISMATVGIIFVAVLRSRMSTDVDAFISEQENLETQKLLIEAQAELNEQIRAFLPKEIFRRISQLMTSERKTVLQSMDEVLRPRESWVACLFSDIRGFTQLTKTGTKVVTDTILPNQKLFTECVDEYRGVPRLTGDLIFAYFDGDSPIRNIHQSLLCAFALWEKNQSQNEFAKSSAKINRYILLSFGKAVVGNIGGADGSREITVLGDPANILSRIDPLTKAPEIKEMAGQGVVLTRVLGEVLSRMYEGINLHKIDLGAAKFVIRDFPEEKYLYVLPVNAESKRKLLMIDKNYWQNASNFIDDLLSVSENEEVKKAA